MSNALLGIVFPGQGSQSVGMLTDISLQFPEIKTTFSEASHVLGYDLWKLVQEGPATELDKTAKTQPALLAASYAIWRILKPYKQLQPALLAGHSLGEYSALVCADALSFADAVRVVAARGAYMQDAAPVGHGALAALVGLDDATVKNICEQSVLANEVLTPANYNSPGQVVIAGSTAAVERAILFAKESGARLAKILPVSVPSHCALMKPAAERLKALLTDIAIKAPAIPVINNVDVTIYNTPEEIRAGLVKQLYMPVRWVETLQKFMGAGISHVIECGPAKVLNGLNKRIAPEMQLTNTYDIASLQALLESTGSQECLIKTK